MSTLSFVHSPDAPVPGAAARADTVAVLLHGYGSDERDLAGLAVYLPQGLPWLSVRAPLRHPSFGYAWYSLEGENFAPAADVAAATSALWEFIDATLPADTLLIPVGFSQGGFMATQMLRTRPDRLAATVVLAGFVAPFEMPADAALAQERRPVFWGRGDADPVIPRAAVERTVGWLPRHSRLEQQVYRGLGHSVSEEELAHVTDFIAREWKARG